MGPDALGLLDLTRWVYGTLRVGSMGPYALGLWDLTRWVNDGLLMLFSLESNAKLPGKPHLEKRPRSFGKMNTVFLVKDRGLFSG